MHATPSTITERNRTNAKRSTGPQTPEGKAASSQNAHKHGFTVLSHRILANEDPAAYAAFEKEIVGAYNPKSPREQLAAIEIARCRWALRRFDDAETALWDIGFTSNGQSSGQTLAGHCISGEGDPLSTAIHSMQLLNRYRRPWDRRHQDAVRAFDRARLDRNREERLSLAKQREASQHARQQLKQATNETPSSPESANGQEKQRPLDQPSIHKATATGFVSSTRDEIPRTTAAPITSTTVPLYPGAFSQHRCE